jgi:hypothetical protein
MELDTRMMQIAAVFFVILIITGTYLYFRTRGYKTTEGFATIALDGEAMPKCFLRNVDAQNLLARFQAQKIVSPNTDAGMAYDELKLILQKALCMDADITGLAAGPYSTYQLPFATMHDMEPVASFVSRCTRMAVRERDIELTIGKLQSRGEELIKRLCVDRATAAQAIDDFGKIMRNVKDRISARCLEGKATPISHPLGVRDPGYFEPEAVKELTPYKITGDFQYT